MYVVQTNVLEESRVISVGCVFTLRVLVTYNEPTVAGVRTPDRTALFTLLGAFLFLGPRLVRTC